MYRVILFACAALFTVFSSLAAAQGVGSKPVRLIVGFTPGSGADTTSRMIASHLSEVLGRNVIVENKPGVASLAAAEFVANNGGDPDMFMFASGSIITASLTNPNIKVEIMEDLQPLMHLGDSQLLLLVNEGLPVSNYQELIRHIKANPGKYNYGSAGMGSASHLYMEEFLKSEGLDMTHIPYKGTGQAFTALLGGEINLMLATQSISGTAIRAGKAKAVAVTGDRRAAGFDDIPTMPQAGNPSFNSTMLSGFFMGGKTPAAAVEQLNQALNQVVAKPEVRERLASIDMVVKGGTAADFRAGLEKEIQKQKSILEYVPIN